MTYLFANAGVPMLFLHIPAILISLIPIIAIELHVARRVLGRPIKASVVPISVANIASMLFGFPMLWLAALLFQMLIGGGSSHGLQTWWQKVYAVTVQAPWLIPYESDLYWMVPFAGFVMLIPAFFVSVWLERLVLERFWKQEPKSALKKFSLRAHCASYVVLVLLWLGYGTYSFLQYRPK
jgi:hypothetical protein